MQSAALWLGEFTAGITGYTFVGAVERSEDTTFVDALIRVADF